MRAQQRSKELSARHPALSGITNSRLAMAPSSAATPSGRHTMQTMWEFSIGRFKVIARIEPDPDVETGWDETGETAEKLASGEWEAFQTEVAVYLRGAKIGADSLCGSIYADPREFFTAHRDPNPMNRNCSIMRAAWRGEGNPDAKVSICHYFPEMVAEAVKEARRWMREAKLAA